MAHLKGFGLENFRVFKDYTWFDFAPITILVGPNNSGKSSLIKALLLLKDNVEKGNLPPYYDVVAGDFDDTNDSFWEALEPSTLVFDGRVHGLNTITSALNNEANPKELKFTITYPVVNGEKEEDYSKKLERLRVAKEKNRDKELSDYEQIKNLNSRTLKLPDRNIYKFIKYAISYQVDDNGNVETSHELELLNDEDECFLRITDHKLFFDPILYDAVFLGVNSNICAILPGYYEKTLKEDYHPSLSEWFSKNGIYDEEEAKELSNLIYNQLGLVKKSWNYIPKPIYELLSNIQYIATSKYEQERVYLDTKESLSQILLKEIIAVRKAGFNVEKFFDISTKTFGIDGQMRVDYDSEKGTIFPNISGQSLLNFGYGYSQIAFLLFKILAVINNQYFDLNLGKVNHHDSSLLLLEEPETNLHPRLQSKLADLIQQYAKNFNVQFIIETHSEYLIRKLQYLTAKGEMKPEDVVIYYFNDPNNIPAGEKQVKKINILEDGSLSDDFGPGFYDEAAHWELELLKLKRNKGRQN